MKCPRCSAALTVGPDEMGFIICSACGARLRSKQAVVVKVQGEGPAPPAARATGADIDSVLARLDSPPNPSATLPPGTPLKRIPRPGEMPAPSAATLDTILAELRALRRSQEEMLVLLREGVPAAPPPALEGIDDALDRLEEPAPPPPPQPVRSRRRKTVLLIDDDEVARRAAVEAFEHAQVPVKAAVDGNGGLAAIAMEKPDVIVMELEIRGAMAGKDVINMIKATMEWLDIPILLYTRVPIESQKEARTVHGADEFVLKGAGTAALVAKVVQLFRRG